MNGRYVDTRFWPGSDPETYSVEYANAVSRAVISKLSGMDYETFLGDRLFNLAQSPADRTLCDVDQLSRFAADRFSSCRVAGTSRRGTPTCVNKDRCAAIQLNPEAVDRFDLRPLIQDVLTNPCVYALKPDPYRARSGVSVRAGLPPANVWGQLWLCDSAHPLKGVVEPYEGDGIFRVRFE